jgi:transposase-like protein
MRRRPVQLPAPTSGFAGFCFPPDVIMVAICSYMTYGLSQRDLEELLAEREPLHIQELTLRISHRSRRWGVRVAAHRQESFGEESFARPVLGRSSPSEWV